MQGECVECGSYGYIEQHHVILRGMGGGRRYDYPLNLRALCHACHYGNAGPHRCRKTDLRYKQELRAALWGNLREQAYTVLALCKSIHLPTPAGYELVKALRPCGMVGAEPLYAKEEIIYKLLGDRHGWAGASEHG